jgi:hypothetical protein
VKINGSTHACNDIGWNCCIELTAAVQKFVMQNRTNSRLSWPISLCGYRPSLQEHKY